MSEEEQIILPSGFKRVDYLQSSGTQWIQTDYCPSNETKIVSDFYFIKAGKNGRFCGNGAAYGGGTDKFTIFLSAYGTGALIFDFGNVRKDKNNYNLSVGRHTISTDKNGIVIDGTVALTTNNTNEFQSTHPMSIFAAGGETSQDGDYWRIYNFIIYENDTVVRYFIPCLNENDEPCMYDVINKKAYNNAGTGEFYYPRKYHSINYNLPAGFKKCVYLQSDGTQWINTQVVPDTETGLYFRALQLSYGNFIPFGVAESSNSLYPPRYNNKELIFRWGPTNIKMMTWDKADDLIFSSYFNFYNSKFAYFDSSDTDVESYITSQTGTFTIPIWLFSYNSNGSFNTTYGKWIGRIYRAKITQGDTLIRDFVPCLDADNRPCMYDLITQEAYYNQSGGTEFTYCVEHELPSDFLKLKYLESDGTQFIKTGYVPTDTTGLYVDVYNTNLITNSVLPMGMRETNGNTYFTAPRTAKGSEAGFGWGAFTSPGGKGDVRYEGTLNWLNDRKAILSSPAFAQRVNSLSTLSFTPLKDIYIFGIHNYDGKYLASSWRIYRAKISEGSEIVRDYVPAIDSRNYKPCMYDLINNVAYYNDGEGEFIYTREFEGTYKGFVQLGGIGNRLGSGKVIHGILPEKPDGSEAPDGIIFKEYISLYFDNNNFIDTQLISNDENLYRFCYYSIDKDETILTGNIALANGISENEIFPNKYITLDYDYDEEYFESRCTFIKYMSNSMFAMDYDDFEDYIREIEVIENTTNETTIIKINGNEFVGDEVYEIQNEENKDTWKITSVNRDTKVLKFKIYNKETNELVSELIPSENVDGKEGMYCTVRNIFLPVQSY